MNEIREIKISELRNFVGTKLFTISGYVKVDGSVTNINAQFGVKKDLAGGTLRGFNPRTQIVVHKPKKGYRRLIIEKLVGCKLKANKQEYILIN